MMFACSLINVTFLLCTGSAELQQWYGDFTYLFLVSAMAS